MKASAKITLPTGVKMGDGVSPFHERGEKGSGLGQITITDVCKVGATTIEVTFDIDVNVTATFVGDRGRGNPSVLVAIESDRLLAEIERNAGRDSS